MSSSTRSKTYATSVASNQYQLLPPLPTVTSLCVPQSSRGGMINLQERCQPFENRAAIDVLAQKVEALERRCYKPCHCAASQEKVLKQVERLVKDQTSVYIDTLNESFGDLRQRQAATEQKIDGFPELLRNLQQQILCQISAGSQHLENSLANIYIHASQTTNERLSALEQKLSSEESRLNDLEMKVLSTIESVEKSNQSCTQTLANLHQDSAQQIKQRIETLDADLKSFVRTIVPERRRQGGTPERAPSSGSVFTKILTWANSPSKDQPEHGEQWEILQNQSQYESQIMKLNAEKNELQRQIIGMTDDLKRTRQDLANTEAEKQRLMRVVMKVKGEIEGTWATGRTPADVASEYDKLFINKRSGLRKALRSNSHTTKVLANKIFQVAYEECHTAVLQELFRELFHHHGPDEDITVAEAQMRFYGQLLGLKHPQLHKKFDSQRLTLKVLQQVSVYHKAVVADPQSDPKFLFTKEAVETALDMITMQPPMVIEYPIKFISESIQQKQQGEWDESWKGDYELEYYRPVLYTNFREQDPSKPASVGMKR